MQRNPRQRLDLIAEIISKRLNMKRKNKQSLLLKIVQIVIIYKQMPDNFFCYAMGFHGFHADVLYNVLYI